MLHTTALLRPAFALAFASGAAAIGLFGALGTEYAKNRVFEVSVSQTSSSERVSMEITMNGEPIDRGGRGGGGGGRTSTFSLTTTDVVLAAEEGAPTRIQRTFDEVSGESSFEMRGEAQDVEMESAFEGLTIVLSAEGDEIEVLERVDDNCTSLRVCSPICVIRGGFPSRRLASSATRFTCD